MALDPLAWQSLLGLLLLLYVPTCYYYGWLLPPSIGIDFPTYYQAARLVFLEGKSPYGLHAFKGLPGFMTETVQPYLSSPPSLLVFWPLARLSPAGARALYLLVSQLCYAGSVWLILLKLTPSYRDSRLHKVTLCFCLVYMLRFDPALSTLGTGEASFVTLFLICLALVALRDDSPAWRIALPLALAILLKTYPAFLLLPLFFRKQYRAIGLTVTYLGMSVVIASLVLPGNIWRSWYTDFLPLTGYINTRLPLAIAWNQSLNAFVMRLFQENYFSKAPLFHPSFTKPVILTAVYILVGGTALCSFRIAKAHTEASKDDEISAYLLLIFLIAPLSWDHHLIYILPAVAVVISLIFSNATSSGAATIVVAGLVLMAWKLPLGSRDITQGWLTLLISAKLYPVLILWMFFVYRLYRSSLQLKSTTPVLTGVADPTRYLLNS